MNQIIPRYSFLLFLLCLMSIELIPLHSADAARLSARKLTSASRASKVRVTNFREGDTLTITSLFFDDQNKLIRIIGRFTKVTALVKNSEFRIVVSGTDISTLPGTSISFRRPSRRGPYMTVGFQAELPAPIPAQWPMLDFMVELVYEPRNQVLVRDIVSLYDFRNKRATASADPSRVGVNLAAQLSNPGIGNGLTDSVEGLEIPVFSQLPFPSLEFFNSQLGAAARESGVQEAVDLVQKYDTCIPLDELEESRFRNPALFPAYFEALAEANVLYQAYQAAQQGVQACNAAFPVLGAVACQLIVNGASCVQSPPQAQDFELCINRIVGKPNNLSVQSASDLQLKFLSSTLPNKGKVEAEIDLAHYNGLIDGRLQDFVVRWRGSACAQVLRPVALLDNARTIDIPWLNDWSLCRDMQFDSGLATTKTRAQNAPQYDINEDPQSSNRLYVSDSRLAGFELLNHTKDHLKGSCAIAEIAPGAAEYLELFQEQLTVILSEVWNAAAPNSQMAQLLDLLFRPFALGDLILPHHTISARINSIRSSAQAGLVVDWSTQVSPIDSEAFGRLRATMVGVLEGPSVQSADALDFKNVSFDISYDVTLNFLNRVLWARGAGPELNRILEVDVAPQAPGPFGSVPPGLGGGGGAIGSESSITGTSLAALHPGFQELTGGHYEIVLERTLDPFVYMPEDPSLLIPGVGVPILYGMRSFKIILKELDKKKGEKVVKKGNTVIEFDASFLDDNFSLSLDDVTGSQLLDSLSSGQDWQISVKKSILRKCPMFTHDRTIDQSNSCERGIEGAIILFLRDQLTGILSNLLSDIPAPQFFDTEGSAIQSVQSQEQSKGQFEGRVTLFGQYQ